MAAGDDEKEVVYRAVADFTNLYIESRRAEAAIDSLGRKHAAANDKVAQSEGKVTRSLDEHRKAEGELQKLTGRRAQQASGQSSQQGTWSPAADNVLRQMRDVAERRARPAQPRAEDYITPREPRGVWNDQAAYDALVNAETKVEKTARGASEALRGQQKVTRDKRRDVADLTRAEAEQAKGTDRLTSSVRGAIKAVEDFKTVRRLPELPQAFGQAQTPAAVRGGENFIDRPEFRRDMRRAATAVLNERRAANAAIEKEQQRHQRELEKAERAAYTEDARRTTAAARETERLGREAERAAATAEREAGARKKRIKELDLGELFTDTRQSFARGVRDVYRQVRSRRSDDALEPPTAGGGAGGGGGGGAWGRFVGDLGDYSDRVVGMITKMGRSLLSWRGLIVAAIAAAGPLISILGSLAGVAVGAVNGFVSLAGSAAALPGIFAAAAAGIGALAIALLPIAGVIKAFTAQQQQATLGTAQLAEVMREASNKVLDAQHAYQQAGRSMVEAQYSEQRSQVALNEARRQAFRDLQDLHNELARASLNERGSILAIKQAEADYRKVLADSNATQLDREAAYLRVQNALADHNELLVKNKRLQEDVTIADRRGVEGNLSVVDANHAAAQAAQGVATASYELTKAQRELIQAQREYNAGGPAMLKANQQLQGQLENLGPKTRTVVEHFLGMGGAFRGLQRDLGERIFGPLLGDLGRIDTLLPIVTTLLDKAAGAIGGVFQRGVEMATSGPWRRDFAELATRNAALITTFGDAGLYVADAFRNITIAAGPFTQWVAEAVKGLAASFDRWSGSARNSGAIVRFLETTKDRIKDLLAIGGNIFSLFRSLFTASGDFTGSLFAGIVKVTAGWAEWGKKQEKHGSAFSTWLSNIKPLVRDVWVFVTSLVTAFARIAANPDNIREAQRILRLLAYDVMPKLVIAFTTLSRSGVISGLVHGLGTFLGIAEDALRFVVTKLDWITGHHPAAAVDALAVAFAGLAGALVVSKFLGLFKLVDAIGWLVRNRGAYGKAISDAIFGRDPNTPTRADLRRYDRANPTTAGGYRVQGTYTGQLTRIVTLLEEKVVLEEEMNGLLRSMLTLLERGALRTPPRPVAGGASDTWPWVGKSTAGTEAEQGAAGTLRASGTALDGSATALDGSAAALDRAAAKLSVAARSLELGRLPGGGPVRDAESTAVRDAERTAAGGAEAAVVRGGGTSWWRRLLPGGRVAGAETAGAEAAGAARGLDPFTWPALALSLAADSGMLGRPGSPTKQAGQALGAIGLGAGAGAMLGGPVGAVLGGVGGGIYSLVRDKGLRERFTQAPGASSTPLGAAARALGGGGRDPIGGIAKTMSQGWDNLTSGRALDQVTGLMSRIGPAFAQAGQVVERNLVAPVVTFFTRTLPQTLSRLPGMLVGALNRAGDFLAHLPLELAKDFVIALGYIYQTAINSWGRLRRWWNSWSFADIWHRFKRALIDPIEHWAKNLVGSVRRWWDSWTFEGIWIKFVHTFVKPISDWITALPGRVRHWWNSWTFEGLWIKFVDGFVKPVADWITAQPGRVRAWWKSWSFAEIWNAFLTSVVKPIENWASGLGKSIAAWWDSWSFAGLWNKFFASVVAPVRDWILSIPHAIGDAFSDAWQVVKGWFGRGRQIANQQQGSGKMSGGLVAGVYDGREDTRPHWLTTGEFVTRRAAVQRPGVRALLEDINEGRFDPATLYAGLSANVRVPALAAPAAALAPSVVNHTVTTGGLSTGDITINNPVRERAPHSLRRTLQSVAYRMER